MVRRYTFVAPRVVAATGNIVRALGFALEMAELAEEAAS
jgi:hypothetical protein